MFYREIKQENDANVSILHFSLLNEEIIIILQIGMNGTKNYVITVAIKERFSQLVFYDE